MFKLWFDVGIVRYTTLQEMHIVQIWLWFDVGIVRYTTFKLHPLLLVCCGLM